MTYLKWITLLNIWVGLSLVATSCGKKSDDGSKSSLNATENPRVAKPTGILIASEFSFGDCLTRERAPKAQLYFENGNLKPIPSGEISSITQSHVTAHCFLERESRWALDDLEANGRLRPLLTGDMVEGEARGRARISSTYFKSARYEWLSETQHPTSEKENRIMALKIFLSVRGELLKYDNEGLKEILHEGVLIFNFPHDSNIKTDEQVQGLLSKYLSFSN